MSQREYRVVIERDETGAWIARVPGVPGCHTHGRTLAQARRRIREALGLWVDDAETAPIREHVRLPRVMRAEVQRNAVARRNLERERVQAQKTTAEAAATLVGRYGLSLRDAAELLGVSHQRVQQLVRRSAA